MPSGLAILSGILGGIGQAGQGALATRKIAQEELDRKLRERQIAEQERHSRALEELTRSGQIQEVPFDFIPKAFQSQYVPSPQGTVKIDKGLAALFQATRQREMAAQAGQEFSRIVGGAEGQPAVIPSAERSLSEAGQPAIPPLSPTQLLAKLGALGPDLPKELYALAEKTFEGQRPMLVPETTTGILDPRTREITQVPGYEGKITPHITPGISPEGLPAMFNIQTDRRGNVVGSELIKGATPLRTDVQAEKRARNALADEGWQPGMQGYDTALFDAMRQITSIAPGGAGYTASQLTIPPPPTGPGRAAPGLGQPTPRIERPALPAASERDQLASYDSTIQGLTNLLGQVEKNKSILGGFLANPQGAGRRALGSIYGPAMSPEERIFLANLASQVVELKRELIGKQQTIPELKGLVDALPDKGDIDASVLPKIQATIGILTRRRDAMRAVLRGSNVQVPETQKRTIRLPSGATVTEE